MHTIPLYITPTHMRMCKCCACVQPHNHSTTTTHFTQHTATQPHALHRHRGERSEDRSHKPLNQLTFSTKLLPCDLHPRPRMARRPLVNWTTLRLLRAAAAFNIDYGAQRWRTITIKHSSLIQLSRVIRRSIYWLKATVHNIALCLFEIHILKASCRKFF